MARPVCSRCGEQGAHGTVEECLAALRASIALIRAQPPIRLVAGDEAAIRRYGETHYERLARTG